MVKIDNLNQNIKSLNIPDSILMLDFMRILEDEDYIENNQFVKCFICDETDIIEKKMTLEFSKKFLLGNFDILDIKEVLDIIQDAIRNHGENIEVSITYCNKCKEIFKILFNKLTYYQRPNCGYNFNYDILYPALIKDGYIHTDGSPIKCKVCNNTEFTDKNEYKEDHLVLEFDCVCNNCGSVEGHYAYGNWGAF